MAKSIGAAIRAARVKLDLAQEEVARRAGMSPPAYNRLELGGTDPRWSTVAKVAAALGLGVDDIVKGTGARAPLPRAQLPVAITRAELRIAKRDLADALKRITALDDRLAEGPPASKTRARR